MNDERWRRLSLLLDELFELAESQREVRLDTIECEDATLAAELRRVLAADERSGLLDAGVEHAASTLMARLAQEQQAFAGLHSEAGKRVGHYRLIERVGSGGMGEVWRAERIDDFEQAVAIKLIRPLMDSAHLRERFARERRILARLEHPNIARLLDGGVSDDGIPWYAMEFVRGTHLVQYAQQHALDTRARVELLLQVCDAVSHAQTLLVVHRDLKPSNILVDAEGRARVLDFGIARLLDDTADVHLTSTGMRVFSPAYAAPEQILGQAVGTAADVFALGAMLYELLSGEVPHPGRSASPDRLIAGLELEGAPRPSDVLRQASKVTTGNRSTRPTRELIGDLDTIVATALQPEPARRYIGAAQLGDDLRRWLEGRPIAAQPDTAGYRMRKFVSRHRIAVGSASTVLLALIAGLALAMWQANVAREQAQRADAEAQRAEREAASANAQSARVRKVKDFMVSVFVEVDPLRRSGVGSPSLEQALDAALDRARTELASDPVLQADVLDDFGEIRSNQGRFEEARALFDTALAVAEREYGPNHPIVAESLLNLGAVAAFSGNVADAATPVLRAIAILERDDGGDPMALANAINSLAAVRQNQGDLTAAREVSERSLQMFRDIAPDGSEMMQSLINTGMLVVNDGDVDRGEALLREALAVIEKHHGPDSANLWPALSSLADVHFVRGDIVQELQALERALAIARATFPHAHPWVATSLVELGVYFSRQDRWAEGEPLIHQGVA
ncbi:MAG: serine/threonine-protein kinase, partial [Dokdonella sp.]